MSEWMNGAIRLNREQAVKLNHELNYPNRDVQARRDCFLASLEQDVYVSPDYCTISVEIPGLTRQQLEDSAQQVKSQSIEDKCQIDFELYIVEYKTGSGKSSIRHEEILTSWTESPCWMRSAHIFDVTSHLYEPFAKADFPTEISEFTNFSSELEIAKCA